MWWIVHFFQFSICLFDGYPLCTLPLSKNLCHYWSGTHTLFFLLFVMRWRLQLLQQKTMPVLCANNQPSIMRFSNIAPPPPPIYTCMANIGELAVERRKQLRRKYVLESVFEEHCARTICLMESYDIKTGCLFCDQDDRSKGRWKDHEDIDIWWYSSWQIW